MAQKYANILFDDAFKVVVCSPEHESLLIRIIELLVPGKSISRLKFRDKENHGLSVSDKITTFDVYCTGDTGEQFIVEMQFSAQHNYADRMLCYATYPIRSQLSAKIEERKERAARGERIDRMDYHLLPIYVISLLNFSIPHESGDILEEGLISRYELCSRKTGELMTGALQFVYLELGRLKYGKGEADKCGTLLERFAYSLKYMHELEQRPEGFEDEMLRELYDAAAFANMDIAKQTKYETYMRTELDIIAEKAYARDEGLAEGRAEGEAKGRAAGLKEGRAEAEAKGREALLEAARRMLAEGLSKEIVVRCTGLSPEEIDKL